MKLRLEWAKQVKLSDGSPEGLIYSLDHSPLPSTPGVYVFGRRYGKNFGALYVGKAQALRQRVRGQLKNLPLMLHVKNARKGERVLLPGQFIPRPGQETGTCIALPERALIRYFLSEGHDLVNKQRTKIKRHEVSFSKARHIVPRLMFLDR